MSNVQFRLELTTAQTTALIAMLVEGLAATAGVRRAGYNFLIVEDSTREGQRNGHAVRISADTQSSAICTTAYDVVVGE